MEKSYILIWLVVLYTSFVHFYVHVLYFKNYFCPFFFLTATLFRSMDIGLCESALHCCDTVPEINLKEERFILTHAFSPWSLGPLVLGF
jgi:hypothetical protein